MDRINVARSYFDGFIENTAGLNRKDVGKYGNAERQGEWVLEIKGVVGGDKIKHNKINGYSEKY